MTPRVGRRRLPGVGAVLLIVMAGASAWAQNMFYREVEKDGRLYVFADGQRYAAFEKSGGAEVGIAAITRLGYGPKGETVVFDSEDAINFYNYKHDLPGEVFAKPKPAPPASPFPSGKVTGLAFGDFYYFAGHHDPKFDEQQGFWLRRGYLGYDVAFSERMNARLRFEMNSNGALAGGSLTPFVKDAYFTWRYHGRQQARLGIQPSLTFDAEDGFWGLRHIEKTPPDLYAIDSARDFGVTLNGPVGPSGLSYGAQFANDSGQNSETDTFKILRLFGLLEAKSGLRVEGNFNHGKRPNGQDRTTAKGLVGFKKDAFRVAGEYVWQERQSGTAAPDTAIAIWSGFGVWDFAPSKASAFARVDSVKGRRGGTDVGLPGADTIAYLPISSASPFQTYLVGIELIKGSIRVSPNVEVVTYDRSDVDSDVVPRLTFFWTW
jgi:hypothetical protein